MKLSRWWDLAIAACVLLCGLILLVGAPAARDLVLGSAGLLLLVVSWLLFGRRAYEGDGRAVAFSVSLVIVSGLVVAAHPVLAIIQCISYPGVWMLARTTRRAVLFNVAIALAVGVGFLISVGTTLPDLGQTALTVAISLGFSLAFGFWISRIATPQRGAARLLENAHRRPGRARGPASGYRGHERAGALARELHDTIAQTLAGLVLLGQRSRRELAAGTLTDDTLELLESGARDALAETRVAGRRQRAGRAERRHRRRAHPARRAVLARDRHRRDQFRDGGPPSPPRPRHRGRAAALRAGGARECAQARGCDDAPGSS